MKYGNAANLLGVGKYSGVSYQQCEGSLAGREDSDLYNVFHQVQTVNEKLDILNRKRNAWQHLIEQDNVFKQKAVQLSLAEQAVHLHDYERHYAESIEELTRKNKLFEDALAECRQAEESLNKAVVIYEQEEERE
ncbi:hypothetical protein ACP8HI_11255 [Paenibacillus sp. FA6]|uniref:hypothetical protein n=1 Tax=Paenibacillus sp. FA6 TaxID=3413029 RepID=UPI003F655F47